MKSEIVKTNANDIKLPPDLYAAAYDNGYSFTQLLENIDPTPFSGPGSLRLRKLQLAKVKSTQPYRGILILPVRPSAR